MIQVKLLVIIYLKPTVVINDHHSTLIAGDVNQIHVVPFVNIFHKHVSC